MLVTERNSNALGSTNPQPDFSLNGSDERKLVQRAFIPAPEFMPLTLIILRNGQDLSQTNLGIRLRKSQPTVSRHLNKLGYHGLSETHKERILERRALMAALRIYGKKVESIADELGVPKSLVSRELAAGGLNGSLEEYKGYLLERLALMAAMKIYGDKIEYIAAELGMQTSRVSIELIAVGLRSKNTVRAKPAVSDSI